MVRDLWEDSEWREHCGMLLSMKHETNIQFLPDGPGESGIGAFRLDTGTVYQYFSPSEFFLAQEQTSAQKDRISIDLKKMQDNQDSLMSLLGCNYIIDRWVFLTPTVHESDLIVHARIKSDEVRASSEPPRWWSSKFEIAVFTDEEHFPEEIRRIYAGERKLRFTADTPEFLNETDHALDSISDKLNEKLTKSPRLAVDPPLLETVRENLLLDYVIGQVRFGELERKYSEVWQTVGKRSRSYLREYQRDQVYQAQELDPSKRLADGLAEKISQVAPSLPTEVCVELGWHFVASWWIQCPLSYATDES